MENIFTKVKSKINTTEISAIIIEDELNAQDLLCQMLEDIAPEIKIVQKFQDLPSALKFLKSGTPDIVFLDLRLPVYNGFELMNFLNDDQSDFEIIIISASDEYAAEAFQMNALDYLLKPLHHDLLESSINKYKSKNKFNKKISIPAGLQEVEPEDESLVFPVSSGYEIVKVKNIKYVKGEGSYSSIFLDGGKSFMVSKHLKFMETLFSKYSYFKRIHRSYIVNVRYVQKIDNKDGYNLILSSKETLPIMPDKAKSVINFFKSAQYNFE